MASFWSWLCNLLRGQSGHAGSNDALKTKLTDAEQGVELGGMKTVKKESDKKASAKPRSKGSLMFAKGKEAEAVKESEEPTCAPIIETLPPVISVPVEALEKGSWRVKGLYSHQVLIIGLRYLDDNWSVDALLDFPRRPNGSSCLVREKIIKDLLTGAAKVKSLPAGDIQAAQDDLTHLSMRQLLRLRVLLLDFAPGSSSANNINAVGGTSAAFIVKVDLLLFQLLGRHATKELLADESNKNLEEKVDSVCSALGHDLTLIAAVAASISESPWWVWWIDEHRIFFHAERFSFVKRFPSSVLEIADWSSPDGNGRTWFAWTVRSVASESQLGTARTRTVTGPDNAKPGASGTPKAGSWGHTMKVLLQKPSGEAPTELEANPQISIADFERAVQQSDPSLQNAFLVLVVGERTLKDDSTCTCLEDYGVTDGCVVTVIRREIPTTLTSSDDGTAKLWNTDTGECTRTFSGHEDAVYSAVFSADGGSVLTASSDRTARLWNTATGEWTQTFSGHEDAVVSAVFSADGGSVLTASSDRTARIWKAATGECTRTLSGHGNEFCSAVFSANGGSVLTASSDGAARLWNADTGECTQTFSGHEDDVCSAVFSADGGSVLTASSDRTARLWNTATGECTRTFSGHEDAVVSATFSADGGSMLTASSDRTARLWNTATGECTRTFFGHDNEFCSAVLSADGGSVLTASSDGAARLWNVATGKCTQTFSGHEDEVNSAVFAP